MTPFDYVFLILPPLLIIYFIYEFRKDCKARATREKEQEAAIEAAFNKWVEDPSEENKAEISRLVEVRYGPGT